MLNQNTLPQRIDTVTLDSVTDVCSYIADWVHRDLKLTGLAALSLQRDLFNGLYLALAERHAYAGALEFVQNRKLSMINQLELIDSGMQPDLLEPELSDDDQVDASYRYALGDMVRDARKAGLM